MVLKDTIHAIKEQLASLCEDLEKANNGNRTASQRVRTGTIAFAKIAKLYRKESVVMEKKEAQKERKMRAKAKSR